MIDGSESEKRKRQLAFKLQNARVYEKWSRMISGDEVEEFTFVICNALTSVIKLTARWAACNAKGYIKM